MYNLYLTHDYLTSGYNDQFLLLLSIVTTLSGIFVLISKNPIVSVLFLIGLFSGISCYLILLGMGFIGLSYLLVYVGAVSILFLFILMLINVRVSELLNNPRNSIPLAIIISLAFNSPINYILPNNIYDVNSNNKGKFDLSNETMVEYISKVLKSNLSFFSNKSSNYITSPSWDSNLAQNTHITSIGNVMYSSHSIWLIISSLILMLAMVGVIIITVRK